MILISIHAPRVGSDSGTLTDICAKVQFQSTLPVWGATRRSNDSRKAKSISIHAPRVGSDRKHVVNITILSISIHAPRVGSDHQSGQCSRSHRQFQSTLPVWGATVAGIETGLNIPNFNPRSPCGERHLRSTMIWPPKDFNPRSPCGERRRKRSPCFCYLRYFNPRSPCGERHSALPMSTSAISFQSTLPVWGATQLAGNADAILGISIHAPRVGSDQYRGTRVEPNGEFQSTLPVWGATRHHCNGD